MLNPEIPGPPLNNVSKCHIFMSFQYYFPGMLIQALPWAAFQFLNLTTFLMKKVFLISNTNLPWCDLRLFPLVLYLLTWEKRLTWLHPPFRERVTRRLLSLLFSFNQLIFFNFTGYKDLAQFFYPFFSYWILYKFTWKLFLLRRCMDIYISETLSFCEKEL